MTPEKTYSYEEARREVRKLLRTDKGEVKELPEPENNANISGFMPYRFLVGLGQGKNFVALAAGMSWADAIEDLKKRLSTERAEKEDGHGNDDEG